MLFYFILIFLKYFKIKELIWRHEMTKWTARIQGKQKISRTFSSSQGHKWRVLLLCVSRSALRFEILSLEP